MDWDPHGIVIKEVGLVNGKEEEGWRGGDECERMRGRRMPVIDKAMMLDN